MLCLLTLPYEVLSNIVSNVDFDDVFNLGLTCKELLYLLQEESICKQILQVKGKCLVTIQSAYTLHRRKYVIPMKQLRQTQLVGMLRHYDELQKDVRLLPHYRHFWSRLLASEIRIYIAKVFCVILWMTEYEFWTCTILPVMKLSLV